MPVDASGRIVATSAHRESVWGLAMANADTRCLKKLIDYGMYDSVSRLAKYCG
jgi:hypothetical protein